MHAGNGCGVAVLAYDPGGGVDGHEGQRAPVVAGRVLVVERDDQRSVQLTAQLQERSALDAERFAHEDALDAETDVAENGRASGGRKRVAP